MKRPCPSCGFLNVSRRRSCAGCYAALPDLPDQRGVFMEFEPPVAVPHALNQRRTGFPRRPVAARSRRGRAVTGRNGGSEG